MNLTSRPKALLFDFDGTLIDSAQSVLASIAQALEATGLAPRVPLGPELIGPPLRKTLATLVGPDSATLDRLAAAFRASYDAHGYRQTEVYAGVPQMLESLHNAGIALFIVTNKRIAPTRCILDHLGWRAWFTGVYALDALEPAAPNKQALVAEILVREGLTAETTWMCGDSLEDRESAAGNGLDFFAAAWGYGQATETETAALPVRALSDPLALLMHAGVHAGVQTKTR